MVSDNDTLLAIGSLGEGGSKQHRLAIQKIHNEAAEPTSTKHSEYQIVTKTSLLKHLLHPTPNQVAPGAAQSYSFLVLLQYEFSCDCASKRPPIRVNMRTAAFRYLQMKNPY